jgi:8-oxo-dGTP pyrophosphatase MutT (NUDIX family)
MAEFNQMKEVVIKGGPVLKPRDAATLIVLDRSAAETKVLMGKRRMDLAFMPGKYVFPGGRVDRADHFAISAQDLRATEIAKLLVDMKGAKSSSRARALALAALREAFEEAGLVIGAKAAAPLESTASSKVSWAEFYATGFQPTLQDLVFFARAITPPGRPRRFDTRFFCVDATAVMEQRAINDGELSGLDWMSLDAARALDIPNITRVVLEDLGEQLADGTLGNGTRPVPFYYQRNGTFYRDLIEPGHATKSGDDSRDESNLD